MKPLIAIPLLILLPVSASGAETQVEAGGFSLLYSSIQMLASLALVVGIILIFHYLSKRWAKNGLNGKAASRHIRVVESRFLAPKKNLVLVEVAGEYLLLSSCGDNLNFIKQIDMIENIEIVGDIAPVSFREAFQEKLKNMATRIPAGADGLLAMAKKGGIRS
jgi:flagellar protein FliO/FliZ